MINEGYRIPSFAGEEFLQTYMHHPIFLFDVASRDALGPIGVLMFWLEEFLTNFMLDTPTTLRGGWVNECGDLFPKTSLLHKISP
jgi:hypothetical protein